MQRIAKAVVSLVTTSLPVFAQGIVLGPAWTGASAVGDVNADGRLDHYAFDSGEHYVFDGATGVAIPFLQRTGGTYVVVGDHDGDGCDDFAHKLGSALTIVSGRDGSSLAALSGTFSVVVGADMDGDGLSDLLLEEAGLKRAVSSRTGAVLWQAGGIFGSLRTCGDENGDGLEDAMFDIFYSIPIPYYSTTIVRGPSTMTGGGGTLLAVGDVDGDGKVDSFETFFGSSWRLTAGGSFATLWQPSVLAPSFVALGDVDGDGRADFYMVDLPAAMAPRVVAGATFLPLPGFTPPLSPAPPFPIALGDLDGDGRSEFLWDGAQYRWNDPAVPLGSRMVRRGTPGTTNDGRRPKVVGRGHAGLGSTFFLDVRGALPNGVVLVLLGAGVDVDLTGLGAPGNRSYTTLDGLFGLASNSVGIAQFQGAMPTSPSLLGSSVSVQAAVLDGLANSLGLVLSSALDMTTND